MLLAILGSPTSWYVSDLRRAAGAEHEVIAVTFTDLKSAVSSEQFSASANGMDLRSVDCLHVRTMAAASLEQVVFRMDILGQLHDRGVRIVNSPKAIEVAVDKYLATARLQAAGLPVPRTIVCQDVDAAMQAFADLGRDVVVKPLFGSEGRGLSHIRDEDVAWRCFKMLADLRAVIYLQEFIPHNGFDTRVLVVGRKLFAMRRRNPTDWRTNAARGAVCEPCEIDAALAELAMMAANAVGAEIAGVDVLASKDGTRYVLEVNAVPGWQTLARTLTIDISAEVLSVLVAGS